ncbi:carbohydrate kinase family protein [Halorussus gelatinilyticus]|uniref:Carbohydrate kinase family protein n=1 Tax=Halorussus gelatinilyticus TaxID=2937524 RepID=A0A8U0IQ67_9EURY|nr:carbohydrate kinase family protein [Halorussus gelatinilyticus]UPW02149.1 carbohydrate kinase family protein [Halorussus gelatinilyticus]
MSDFDARADSARLDAVAVGSAVEDRIYGLTNLPEPDGGAFVRDEATATGGVAANVAAGLARLGRETGVVSRLGDDEAADRILADLRERAVDARRVRRGDPDERTTYSMILRDPEGERMIVNGGEAVPNLRLSDADREYVRRADLAFTSAYAPDPVVSALVEDAERDDGDGFPPLVFDLAGPLSELEDRATRPETLDALLPVCDCFVANAVSARSYLGEGPRGAIETLRERGVRRAAVTRGTDGALLLTDDGTVLDVPAFAVETADTTGAGDAFTAGLLHAWFLGDRGPREAGRFAAATAALNCTAETARGGLPTEDDVFDFLDSR